LGARHLQVRLYSLSLIASWNMFFFFLLLYVTSHCSIAYIVEGKRVFSTPSICTALVTLANGIGSDAAAEWISRAINRFLSCSSH
jgi:hypothetical protein